MAKITVNNNSNSSHEVEGSSLTPPDDLAKRVGGTTGEKFIAQGATIKQCLLNCLPVDFTFEDKRILDWGCGVGRVLRHFLPESKKGTQFYGCDIHAPSIACLADEYPEFHIFCSGERPPLPLLDNYFDMIYCVSVFTHLVDTWEIWLRELHRILKPNGIVLASYHHRTAYQTRLKQNLSEAEIGFKAHFLDRSWDKGGPSVFHSNWWIIENWGKIFQVEYIFQEGIMNWQSVALLRKVENIPTGFYTKIIKPYPYSPFIPKFEGSLTYNKFHGLPWSLSHGILSSDKCLLRGWFASIYGPIAQISFAINGDEIKPLSFKKISKIDVNAKFPDFPDSVNSGFEAKLNLEHLVPGTHELIVTAKDKKGRIKEIQATIFKQ